VDWVPALVQFYRREWPRLVWALVLAASATAAGLAKPWPLARLIDGWRGTGPFDDRLGWALAAFVLYAAHAVLGAALSRVLVQTGLRGLKRVREAVFRGILGMSLRRLQGSKAGDLLYRATWDTFAFQTLFHQGLFTCLTASASLLAMGVVMWRMNRPLAWVAIATVSPLLGVMKIFARGIGRRADAAQAADARLAERFQQTVSHLPVVQGYGGESAEALAFATDAEAAEAARGRQHRFELAYLAAVGVVFAAGTAGILWLGAREVEAGRLSTGGLLVFLAYLAQFYEPLQQLSQVGTTVSNAGAGARRVLELLESPAEPAPARDPARLPPPAAVGRRIELEDVTFAYRPSQPVLTRQSLDVRAGEAVALVGRSGIGKSTLLQLIPRFFDPDEGCVRMDGIDVRRLALAELRRNIAWVPQEPVLLPGTVADNIAYGSTGVSREAVEAAAAAAQAHDFIRRLPRGYDTVVGDGAIRMSVGEKQRLNLARAFLRDAPVLLLDEPTSALDEGSEELVMRALAQLRHGRTVLMIAHRERTLAIVDRVVRMGTR
jgi:ATP-binding cassette subfamily B protein/subfamily B ATP-binding cassette protein MsbA